MIESKQSYIVFSRRVREELGQFAQVPNRKSISHWTNKFLQTGSVQRKRAFEKLVSSVIVYQIDPNFL
jgi:hypothetical protein